jgi:hypothetical protein
VTEEILNDLAQRLSELRLQLEQVRTELTRRDVGKGSLRCYLCGRMQVPEQLGWTLRLCADDELHAFCPDCDRRQLRGSGVNAHDQPSPLQEMPGPT